MTRSQFLSIITVISLGISSAVFADDQSNGCGLGWKISKRNSLLSSTTRTYVNFTFSNTLGMTSGTSGCAKHSIVKNEKKAVYYAEANYGHLMVEMAEGNGEHLSGLASVLGCQTTGISSFNKLTQDNYIRVFSSTEEAPGKMLKNVIQLMQEHPEIQQQCGMIG